MNTRRDFLAGAAGALVTGATLPLGRKPEPGRTARTARQRELLILFQSLGDAEQTAMLNGMSLHHAGMPIEEAMRGVYVELGRPVPAGLLG